MEINFTVRRAINKDLDDILRLNFGLFTKEHKDYDPDLNMNWTYGRGREVFGNRINNSNDFVAVAENDGKVVGYLCGSLYKLYWKNGNGAELDSIFIDEDCRDKGIGGELIAEFINWCKAKGVDYITVRESEKNKLGDNFYKKNGFRDYDVVLEMKLNN